MATTTAPDIDFDAEFEAITQRLQREARGRNRQPLVRFWDGDYNLRGTAARLITAEFSVKNNETGPAQVDMPLDYYLSRWLLDAEARETSNVHVTIDKDGWRGGYRMERCSVIKDDKGSRIVRVMLKHDYEELKHILCWANPFLPAEIQFPKLWVLFGRARWALKTTLFVNLLRLESSLWMLPDDPLDGSQWGNLDQSTWSQVVAPDTTEDHSPGAIVHARFQSMHDVQKKQTDDAQLTWTCRRYLDGDPPPWEGADLKHGCLVWDLVDKSGRTTGTSFGGNLFGGLVNQIVHPEGESDSFERIPDPALPDEAFRPGWKGTIPAVPAVIFRDGEHSGVETSQVDFMPATSVGVVSGGHSPDFVNTGISVLIRGAGAAVSQISGGFIADYGPVADALLKPLYTDVFAAFGKWKDVQRAQGLGEFHYHEKWVDGSDTAYTLSWLIAMRTGLWQTREQTRATVTIADGHPWKVGANGRGHFFLGDRVGFTCAGTTPGQVWVNQVSELSVGWKRGQAPAWKVQIGQREPENPLLHLFEQVQDALSMFSTLGVL